MRKIFYIYFRILLVCGLFFLLGFISLNQMSVYTPDSARYLIWANSLAKAEGFIDATTPEPTRYVVHSPLFPIFLAPSAFFFPYDVVAAKVTTLLIGCIAIFLLYLWLKKKVGESYALAGSILLALNPLMMLYSTQILSDVSFAVCLILFFFLTEKMLEEQGKWTTEAAFIAVIVAGIFLREVGLTLMLGATVFFVWKKQYRRAVIILLVSLSFYLLWYIRNEVIVAGVEDPPLRNTRAFFNHLYTSQQASLLAEFGERLWSNLIVYLNLIGKLLLMPDFSSQSYMVISPTDPFVAFMLKLLPVGQYILIGVTLGFSAIGIWQLKNSKTLSFLIIFLICYLGPILLYPVVDVRFLFPIAFIMIYLSIVGAKAVVDRWSTGGKKGAIRFVMIAGFFVLLLPNISWLQSYVWNSRQYAQSPQNYYAKLQEEKKPPEMFTKPLHLAADWIMQHSDSSTVILSRWKELTIWLKGRKVVESNPRTVRDQFYYQLRDYGVKYVVAVRWRSPINEYETLFIQMDRYVFIPVYSVGNVVIYEVKLKELSNNERGIAIADSNVRLSYERAIRLLEDEPLKSEKVLQEIVAGTEGYSMVTFHIAVAKEFAGQLDSAALLFEKFRSLWQAAPYVQQAWFHLDIISRLKMASFTVNSLQRAELFQKLAVNYWGLGYRRRAMNMLSQSLEAESQYFPALIASAIYSLQLGDTAAVWIYLSKARLLEPNNILVNKLSFIQKCLDTLRVTKVQSRQFELRLKIIEAYIAMGLRETAIDELQALLRLNPSHQVALRMLAELFEAKHRYEPALRCYKTILAIYLVNIEVKQKVKVLSVRF